MDKKEAARLIERYNYWLKIKIPALELKCKYAVLSCTPLYSEMPSKGGIGDKVGNAVISISQTEEELSILKFAISLLDMIYSFLDGEYCIIFNLMKEPKKYSWVQMADIAKVTEKEFRNRRERILEHVIETFGNETLPFEVYQRSEQYEGNFGAEKGQ